MGLPFGIATARIVKAFNELEARVEALEAALLGFGDGEGEDEGEGEGDGEGEGEGE